MTEIDRTLITHHYNLELCTQEKDFKKRLKRYRVPLNQCPDFLPDGAAAYTHILENSITDEKVIIVTIQKSKDHEAIYSLIHEAVHVWQQEVAFIQELNPSDEFEAYSIGEIAKNLIEAYKK